MKRSNANPQVRREDYDLEGDDDDDDDDDRRASAPKTGFAMASAEKLSTRRIVTASRKSFTTTAEHGNAGMTAKGERAARESRERMAIGNLPKTVDEAAKRAGGATGAGIFGGVSLVSR